MDDELFEEHHEGIIATTGCPSGAVQTRLRLGQYDEALKAAGEYQDIFGKENYFLELMDHGLPIEPRSATTCCRSPHLNIPLLATNDSHYVTEDQAGHEARCRGHQHRWTTRSGSSSTATATSCAPPRRCARFDSSDE